MTRLACDTPAPEFGLPDVNGNMVALADFYGRSRVLLVFSRGLF